MNEGQSTRTMTNGAGAMSLASVRADSPHGTDLLLTRTAGVLTERGLRLAGVVQMNTPRSDRPRCEMDLSVLSTDHTIRISQDRGAGARGCHLDHGALEEAVVRVEEAIRSARPDLVIINKFGKREAQGRGFVPVISASLEASIPVLVGVNGLNRPDFDLFASSLVRELSPKDEAVLAWCLTVAERTAPVS